MARVVDASCEAGSQLKVEKLVTPVPVSKAEDSIVETE